MTVFSNCKHSVELEIAVGLRGGSKAGTQFRLQEFTQAVFPLLWYFRVLCTAAIEGTDVG